MDMVVVKCFAKFYYVQEVPGTLKLFRELTIQKFVQSQRIEKKNGGKMIITTMLLKERGESSDKKNCPQLLIKVNFYPLLMIRGCGCSTAAEHTSHNLEDVASKPAGCWPFSALGTF